jgi:hypothetical protein
MLIVSDFVTFVGENVSRLGTVALIRLRRGARYAEKVEARLAILYILYMTLSDRADHTIQFTRRVCQVSCLVQLPPEPF